MKPASSLPYKYPTSTNALSGFDPGEVAAFAESTRPILSANTAALLGKFLRVKRASGSEVEQALYADMSEADLVTRLLLRRPLAFVGGGDK